MPFSLKVYNSLSGCCGIPQLGRKLNQVGDSHFFAHIARIDCLILYIEHLGFQVLGCFWV